jgi:glucose dehydrogenase
MLATSVWNLSDFWKVGKRANIYLMMFLVVAVLVMPLVQPQEAGAPLATGTVLAIIGIGVAIVGIGTAIALAMCGGSTCSALVGNGHLVTCYDSHGSQGVASQYYICNEGQRWAHGGCNQN